MEKAGRNEFLNKTDELRKLILENPDLPLVVFAGQNACAYDWSTMVCTDVKAYIGEFLDCKVDEDDERVYDDRAEFEDMLWDYYEETFDGSDSEFETFIENKLMNYEPFWEKCIILYVDN